MAISIASVIKPFTNVSKVRLATGVAAVLGAALLQEATHRKDGSRRNGVAAAGTLAYMAANVQISRSSMHPYAKALLHGATIGASGMLWSPSSISTPGAAASMEESPRDPFWTRAGTLVGNAGRFVERHESSITLVLTGSASLVVNRGLDMALRLLIPSTEGLVKRGFGRLGIWTLQSVISDKLTDLVSEQVRGFSESLLDVEAVWAQISTNLREAKISIEDAGETPEQHYEVQEIHEEVPAAARASEEKFSTVDVKFDPDAVREIVNKYFA